MIIKIKKKNVKSKVMIFSLLSSFFAIYTIICQYKIE